MEVIDATQCVVEFVEDAVGPIERFIQPVESAAGPIEVGFQLERSSTQGRTGVRSGNMYP